MKYLFESAELNPVELEKQAGLNRGTIKEVKIYGSGAVEVEIADSQANDTNRGKIETILKKYGLPRGKKPEKE